MYALSHKEKTRLCNYLFQFVTDKRNECLLKLIKNRTRYLCLALENIYQSQNASAVLRTADCFGIQDVHIIENNNSYNLNPDVSLGAEKWLNLYKYNEEDQNNSLKCIQALRAKKYRIVATTPHTTNSLLTEFPMDQKTALFFGTEMQGLSPTVMENADAFMKIPMYGFTESFNISVSVALSVFHLSEEGRNSIKNWSLTQEEQIETLLQWLKASIAHSESIVQKYLSDNNLQKH
jgi:tRNA (guanosine-2'-O-)-methyltransferase